MTTIIVVLLSLAVIAILLLTIGREERDRFDEYYNERPACYKSNPSRQERAERDCYTCPCFTDCCK
jgi:hypothetical protein